MATIEPPAPIDLLQAPHAEDDAVDVDAEHPAVTGEVVTRAADAGVEEREVDAAAIVSQASGSETSKPVARSSGSTAVPSSSSRRTTAAPIPDALPVTSALRNKDDLAHVLALLDQPVGVGSLGRGDTPRRPPA